MLLQFPGDPFNFNPWPFFLHKSQLKGSLLVWVNVRESCYQVIKRYSKSGPVLLLYLHPAFLVRLL